ncbi:MAG: FAD-dependent oxidoreductase [Proteobacteria bacterium]|nr:FAD-dependent oxidoreductase [Pseudomonadota bacterium]
MKEYVIVGAGPAAICALVKLISAGVARDKLLWIDSKFKVGSFGTDLSIGSSVPGNTSVASYQRVNKAIYSLFASSLPKKEFELNSLPLKETCPLKIAAEPLQEISDYLRESVPTIEGWVTDIQETKSGLQLNLKSDDKILAKRALLAIGAVPKTLDLPDSITLIPPNIAFIESELQKYIKANPTIKKVAVIGSSHSAALAVMHLLKAGIAVKQFMNKEYLFATPALTKDGKPYTQFDNTGLKGEVAAFTRFLLNEEKNNKGIYTGRWQYFINKNKAISSEDLSGCSHAVITIGYKPASTLQINNLPISEIQHDNRTTQLQYNKGKFIPGLFGLGIAFPLEVTAFSGEVELAVGVEKFWSNINDKILREWENNPAFIEKIYSG